MKGTKLSKRELETINRAWDILSRWTENVEAEHSNDYSYFDDYDYSSAMNAVVGLCEFVTEYTRNQ